MDAVNLAQNSFDEPNGNNASMRISKTTLLKLGALGCFWMAYRFAAHGRSLNDNVSFVIGCVALAAAIVLVVCAVRIDRNQT